MFESSKETLSERGGVAVACESTTPALAGSGLAGLGFAGSGPMASGFVSFDVAFAQLSSALVSMGGKCFDWLCANAPKYGFYLQGSDPKSPEFEAWHWQYVCGDKPPVLP